MNQTGRNLLSAMLVLLAISVIIRQNLDRQSVQDAIACKANLKNIATAVEMYSTDNSGRYPHSLEPLVPLYLKAIPTCPRTGCDSYSATFESNCLPDRFTITCRGDHRGDPEEFTVRQPTRNDSGA